MVRLGIVCLCSLVIYWTLFAFILDRPLSLGPLRSRIDTTLSRGADRPKLVILAGSNGPFSHRCETIALIVNRPCINAGVATGIGLDYLFARWKPLLQPGDWVYLPLEETQYARSRATMALGPDASIMLRHDRITLFQLSAHRWLGAAFTADLRAFIMSPIETLLFTSGLIDPHRDRASTINRFGDRIGHTPRIAEASAARLALIRPFFATPQSIQSGYGSQLVREFLGWAQAKGVIVVGGPSTGFDDASPSTQASDAIASIYEGDGTPFLHLANKGRYPRAYFFDTQDHLHEQAQIAHSIIVASALVALMEQGLASNR